MCGIVGFNWEDDRKIRELASLLEHRGPEQEGYHVADCVSLGHKRLRILDLSERGRQPMYNEDDSVCVVYNGEIYNSPVLRTELEKAGHRFISTCDTEVLVHGYEQWGTDLPRHLNGQFAFCILDRQQKLFVLARDRLGIKPLYYHERDGRFLFGSEMKVFLRGGVDRQIDPWALEHYLLFGYTPVGQSILKDVRKFPPGTCMVYDLQARAVRQCQPFWQLCYEPDRDLDEEEAARQLSQHVERAVKSRLLSDVPLGAFLSGGLDSSILVAVMRRHVTDLDTFSIGFDRPDFDESRYATAVSRAFGTRHHEIRFDARTVCELVPQLPHYYDEPFGDPSMIPTCLVCQVARRHVTVAMSGTGGDELFGGYPRYRQLRLLRRLNQLPGVLRGLLGLGIRGANRLLRRDVLNKLQSFLGPMEETWRTYAKLYSHMFRDRFEDASRLNAFEDFHRHFEGVDDVTGALRFDTHEYLPECLLTKEDRASMAVALEVRVPLLDHHLVEFAARLPIGLKVRGRHSKYILRKAFEDVLPEVVLTRRKQGFGVPLVHYLRHELRSFAEQAIFDKDVPPCFDWGVLRELWQRHQAGTADHSKLFWSVMMFNLWYRMWMT